MKSMKRLISGIISATMLFGLSISTVEAKEPLHQEEIPELNTVTEDRIDEFYSNLIFCPESIRSSL